MRFWITPLLVLGLASPAHAEWYKASSDHFVVYADDSEKDVRRFAEMLESYHEAIAFVIQRKVEKPSPSNRVTIFAVGSVRDLKALAGGDNRFIAGFYVPRAGGSRAFIPDIRMKSGELDFSATVLLHEYAHHYLISTSRFAMPRWLSEGAAEFFASAQFKNDGTVSIGRPALHRSGELAFSDKVTIEELLDQELYEKRKSKRHDSFYGRSWTLYHYLIFSEERKGQLTDYWIKVAQGMPSLAAARHAFGDLAALDKEMDRYLKSRKMFSYAIGPDLISPSPVTVSTLSPGEAAMMPIVIQSQRGVSREEAEALVVEARSIAARYPQDAAVLAALAEAEHDAGNYPAAIAAADRALAIDPATLNAYIQKGYALFKLAGEAGDTNAAYLDAVAPFTQLNHLEPDHPLPLMYYYRSFVDRGVQPPELARHALERAAQIAPFDQGLWMSVGFMQASEGKIAIAVNSLLSVANDPHGGGLARQAQAYIAALRNAPEGQPFGLDKIVVPVLPEVDEGPEETLGG